jgi:hypothetical protein
MEMPTSLPGSWGVGSLIMGSLMEGDSTVDDEVQPIVKLNKTINFNNFIIAICFSGAFSIFIMINRLLSDM